MNNLFSAHWNGAEESLLEIDCPPASGFGRLLAAVAVIGLAVCVLDHVSAGKAAGGDVVAYGSSQQGSLK